MQTYKENKGLEAIKELRPYLQYDDNELYVIVHGEWNDEWEALGEGFAFNERNLQLENRGLRATGSNESNTVASSLTHSYNGTNYYARTEHGESECTFYGNSISMRAYKDATSSRIQIYKDNISFGLSDNINGSLSNSMQLKVNPNYDWLHVENYVPIKNGTLAVREEILQTVTIHVTGTFSQIVDNRHVFGSELYTQTDGHTDSDTMRVSLYTVTDTFVPVTGIVSASVMGLHTRADALNRLDYTVYYDENEFYPLYVVIKDSSGNIVNSKDPRIKFNLTVSIKT